MNVKTLGALPKADNAYRAQRVALILDVSLATVWRWAAQGRLRPIKIGPRTTVFAESEVQALLSGGSSK